MSDHKQPPAENPAEAETMDAQTAQQVEREKLTRRAALRKLGFGAGIAALSMFSVDDLARMVGQRMERMAGDNKVAQAVAKEFQQAGIALANPSGPSGKPPPCPTPCAKCGEFYAKQKGNIQDCQKACGDCCNPTKKKALPCGTRADADITLCQQTCADHFGQPG